MQSKKLCRFTAAFIGFLLLALGVFALPVSAVDTFGEDSSLGGGIPGQGGVEASTDLVDMGSLAETDITSKTSGEFTIANAAGVRLDFINVQHRESGTKDYTDTENNSNYFYGKYFKVHGALFLNSGEEFPYYIVPFTSGNEKLTARDEPYVEDFRLVFADSSGNEYTADVSVSLTVTQEGQHLARITAINGHIYTYMSETIYATDEALRAIRPEDFEITATDEDGETVDLQGLRIESYDVAENSVIFVFSDIQSEAPKTITVSVKHKGDTAPKTAQFDTEGNSTESNIPEDGNVVIKVVDNETRQPVSGASVELLCAGSKAITATTDSQGYARFSKLQPGIYSISVRAAGYGDVAMQEMDLSAPEVVVNLARPGDLGEGEASNIQIIVKNQYGEPVKDATVQFFCAANNGKGAAQTNAQGVATFHLTANNYEITVTKSGHFPSGSKVLSVANKEESLEITLEQRFMCSVMTTVVDENDRPVSGAEVYYTCPTDNDVGRSKTNSQGKTSEWISIRANDYILTVSKAGFETYERRVRVSESNSEFTVTLERVRSIEDDSDDDDDDNDSSSSSSGGSGSVTIGGSSSENGAKVNSKNQVVASEVNRQIQQGIREAAAAGKTASAEVKVKNAGSITPEALRSMRLTTEASKGKAKLLADSTSPDGKIAARLYIDPEKSFYVDKEIKLGVSMEQKDTQKTQSTFERYFDNKVSVVHFDHEGAFGMNIDAAVKVDLTGMNTKNLLFYSYNSKTNRYTPITNADAYMDENGFLHFTTNMGGDLVITDKPLTPRS